MRVVSVPVYQDTIGTVSISLPTAMSVINTRCARIICSIESPNCGIDRGLYLYSRGTRRNNVRGERRITFACRSIPPHDNRRAGHLGVSHRLTGGPDSSGSQLSTIMSLVPQRGFHSKLPRIGVDSKCIPSPDER